MFFKVPLCELWCEQNMCCVIPARNISKLLKKFVFLNVHTFSEFKFLHNLIRNSVFTPLLAEIETMKKNIRKREFLVFSRWYQEAQKSLKNTLFFASALWKGGVQYSRYWTLPFSERGSSFLTFFFIFFMILLFWAKTTNFRPTYVCNTRQNSFFVFCLLRGTSKFRISNHQKNF